MHARLAALLEALPDPLIDSNGQKVLAVEQWQQHRRPQILDLFREHIYGREPLQRPETLSFSIVSQESALEGMATRKQVNVTFAGPGGKGEIPVQLFVPNKGAGPLPAFVLIDNRGAHNFDNGRSNLSEFWPVESIVSRGYAAAIYQTADLDPDHDDGFRNGIHGIFDPEGQPRPSNAWATISAWAWGASRVMDYLETDPDIDASRVALVGHSRGGKTALWAGAIDERFAMVVSNNSGSTGAAISRGKTGERIHNINAGFPHWFNENYKSFNEKENELPVDQHMLLSLISPRLLYVTSASEDAWADPESEFMSCVFAEPVYALYGFNGLGTRQFPPQDSPIHSERMGYHVRTGQHDLTRYDWICFMDFADERL